ncbi:NAD(P)H-binding protein [Actinomycetes bacterium KLBMP 9759]
MTILVTGATGNIGRLVVDHLLEEGATDIRALTTNPKKAALPPGVDVALGYIRKPETLRAALDGVEKMYLAPAPETVSEVVAMAAKAGVQLIVDVSGEPDQHWGGVNNAVEESGVPFTHLWPGEFMENATIWTQAIREKGVVHDAYANSANAMICMDDIAAVAARLLVEDGHVGKVYPLTGPETLTRAEKVRQIGVALGREIPYVEISPEEAAARLEPDMGEFAQWYVEGMRQLAEHPQPVSPAFAEVMGRPGTRFADWVAANTAEFR